KHIIPNNWFYCICITRIACNARYMRQIQVLLAVITATIACTHVKNFITANVQIRKLMACFKMQLYHLIYDWLDQRCECKLISWADSSWKIINFSQRSKLGVLKRKFKMPKRLYKWN